MRAALRVLLWVLASAGASPAAEVRTETRFLLGTVVTISIAGGSEEARRAGFDEAFRRVAEVDRTMGRRPGSPLASLNARGGGVVDAVTAEVLAAALAWAKRSAGAFDPTVAPLLDLWGVERGPHPPPSPGEVARARARVGWRRVRLDRAARRVDLAGTALDLGGIAKGHAVDLAAAALRARGLANFIVDAGGDLYVAGSRGERPWKVGIRHPRDPDDFLRIVEPREGALVTSGDYERGYDWRGRRVHHLFDPRTGEPAPRCRSVTVWAPRAVDADALSTAVFVLGPAEGLALVGPGAALVVDAAGGLHESPGFAAAAPEAGP